MHQIIDIRFDDSTGVMELNDNNPDTTVWKSVSDIGSNNVSYLLVGITTDGNINLGDVLTVTGIDTPSTSTAAFSGSVGIGGSSGPTWTNGSTVPTSIQPIGSLYSQTNGSTGSTLYVSQGSGTWNPVAGV